jgi:FlaA1/EpsC-like NDP-sugar epimerase
LSIRAMSYRDAVARGKRLARSLARLAIQGGLFALVYYASHWLRFEGEIPLRNFETLLDTCAFVVLLKLAVFAPFRIIGGWRRPVTFRDFGALVEAATLSSLLLAAADFLLLPERSLPRSVFLLDWGGTIMLIGGLRAVSRLIAERYQPWLVSGSTPRVRALIVGADNAGESLLRAINRSRALPYHIVGFIDDDPRHHGTHLAGVPVLGGVAQTCALAQRHRAAEVLVAAEGLPGRRLRKLVAECRRIRVAVKVLPSYEQLIQGKLSLRARDVSIEDLLRREPVALDVADIRQWLTGRVLMVTGSSGSIGSEICRQLLQFQPAHLVLVDRAESGQFFLERELRNSGTATATTVCVADITDRARMQALFERFKPEILFHAAAYKHVPMMEAHPGEAIKNNVLGTRRLADLAHEHNLRSFVLVSTDKAINPTSVMGACKRVAELYVQALSQKSACRFVTVRFGNVLDSVGSVVPIFREQIARGGPVTVTHPEMQRYFMTIPEAAQLVIQAGTMGKGGEVFVLDMGEPLRIVDLANDMIRLSGFRVGQDIEIEYIGRREGEKLVEELHGSEEQDQPTRHPKIRTARTAPRELAAVAAAIDRLRQAAEAHPSVIRAALAEVVPEYHPTGDSAPVRLFSDAA